SSAELLRHILDAMLAHPGWKQCDGCQGQRPDLADRCPIWENFERLQQPLLRERLTDLLELCDRSGYHLPIRQLLSLASNMLVGHPRGKDFLLRCNDVPIVLKRKDGHLASLYRNAFGENLSPGRRASVDAFEVLGRFGVGEETS